MMQFDLKNPATQKGLLAVLLGGGVLALFFLTHFLPFGYPNQSDKLNTLKADYDKKSTELARARATVSDLPRFEAEYARLHDRWIHAAELLPTDRQIAVLLRKVTLSAQQTGVEFVMFRPSAAKTQQHYTELPMSLSVFGGYHQIGSFVAELSNMRRIITVGNLALHSNTKGDATATVAAEFTASAYSLDASASALAPAANASASAGANANAKAAPAKEGGSRARKSS